MEQQQFKVSFSVGTKILVSVLVLLAIVVTFLNVSAILLLKDDKRAYTYQSQSTTAVLAGKEFVNVARHQLDTLRLALASVDPTRPVTPQQISALQSLIDNQSEILGVSVSLVDTRSGSSRMLAKAVRDKEFRDDHLTEADLTATPDWIQAVLPELLRDSYAFINMSKVEGTPTIGILVADLKLQGNPAGMPVALGVSSIREFGNELGGLELTVASRSGWILFDTDPTALFSKKNISKNPLFQAAASSKLASGALEYDSDRGEHFLGSYVNPGLNVLVLTRVAWQKAMKATYALTEKFILLGLMAIGIAVIFSIFFAKTLTAPIHALYEATKEVARGNFSLELKAASRDELGALTGSFNVMSHQISELISAQAEKIHLENELAIASTVQQTLIPPAVFENKNIYVYSHYQSASECGGDWWGFFGVGKKMTLMIADATGHGIPSALITASARSCFSVMHKLAQEDPDFSFSPSAMLNYANRVVFDASLAKIMMTFFIGVIDFEAGTLTYSSAGHNPPWLFKKEEDGYKLRSLTAVGQRLGEQRDAPPFEEKVVELSVGDMLFLYTDGLLEGKDIDGEMYGKKRVRKLVEEHLAAGPEEVVRNLMSDFVRYNEGKLFDDDVTIALARILWVGSGASSLDAEPSEETSYSAPATHREESSKLFDLSRARAEAEAAAGAEVQAIAGEAAPAADAAPEANAHELAFTPPPPPEAAHAEALVPPPAPESEHAEALAVPPPAPDAAFAPPPPPVPEAAHAEAPAAPAVAAGSEGGEPSIVFEIIDTGEGEGGSGSDA